MTDGQSDTPNNMPFIPVCEPIIGEQEKEYVADALASGWVSSAGKYVDAFEEQWASYCQRSFGITVSSGTAALEVAVRACQIGPGDEVIIPNFTIISCALSVIHAGATPVFVDVDPDTWTLVPEAVEAAITPRTKAVMVVHMYSQPAHMQALLDIAKKHELMVIEDAAQAHGAQCLISDDTGSIAEWRRCGSFGAVSCFSFYGNKILTTGEGGMILTNDPDIAERARSFRNLCFTPERRFLHKESGFNYRLTNIQAAIGLGQLERIEHILDEKRRIGHAYTKRLSELKGIRLQTLTDWAKPVYWMFGLVLTDECNKDATEVMAFLKKHLIDSRPFFVGMHQQPVFKDNRSGQQGHFPVSDTLAERGLYLPSGLKTTTDMIERICATLEEAIR